MLVAPAVVMCWLGRRKPALMLSGPRCHRLNAEGPFTRQGVGLPEIVDGNGMVSDACCIVRESRFVAL